MKFTIYLFFLLFFSLSSYAGNGFRISLQGNQALAMGHTGVAVVNSAESAFFNPAALPYLSKKLNVSVGGFGSFGTTKWQESNSETILDAEGNSVSSFYLYAAYKLNDWISTGIAVYTPFISNMEWQRDWQGSHLINQMEISTVFFQPLLALKLSKYFSVGGGPILATGNFSFNRNVDRSSIDENGTRSNITYQESGTSNWGWSAGFLFSPTEDLKIGFNYRGEIDMDTNDASVIFSNFSEASGISNTQVPFQSRIPLPAELRLGFSYQITNNFLFAFDYNRVFWETLDEVDINFDNENLNNTALPLNFKNSNTFRFGLQYNAMRNLIIRGGMFKQESPNTKGNLSPAFPNNDGQGYTSGISVRINKHLTIDSSFIFVREKEITDTYKGYVENGETIPFEGKYLSNLFAFGLGISYKL
jgi:long-chain fatty acid transport protein